MHTNPDHLVAAEPGDSPREPRTPLAVFDSSWTLLVLCVVGAFGGLAASATSATDASAGVAAGLGAVAGIVVHYLGRGLLWTYLGWAAVRALRERRRHPGR